MTVSNSRHIHPFETSQLELQTQVHQNLLLPDFRALDGTNVVWLADRWEDNLGSMVFGMQPGIGMVASRVEMEKIDPGGQGTHKAAWRTAVLRQILTIREKVLAYWSKNLVRHTIRDTFPKAQYFWPPKKCPTKKQPL